MWLNLVSCGVCCLWYLKISAASSGNLEQCMGNGVYIEPKAEV